MSSEKSKKPDWREAYVICEHVAEDQALGTRHSSFRVCCEECYDKGFLQATLFKKEQGKLAIGYMELG